MINLLKRIPILANRNPWQPLVLPVDVLFVAYVLLALTLTDRLTHGEIMQRCVLMDPRRARIWSVGNIEIGLAYSGVFRGMLYYFLFAYARNRQHILDLAIAAVYLLGSFALDYWCVATFHPFLALLVGDVVVMSFTLLVSQQVWFRRLLGIFVPIVFLTCGVGHFLEGLSFWRMTYMVNTPWTMVTADIGFAVLVNASRFPAFIRGEDVLEELALAKNRAAELQAEVDKNVLKIGAYAGVLELHMAELAAANSKLEALSRTDALTGIGNRLAFEERLEHEISTAQYDSNSLILLLLDVDHFKEYNDLFGHPAGDAALAGVAKILRQTEPAAGLASRIGGEEFALILPGTTPTAAGLIAEQIRSAVENHAWKQGTVTLSVGVAALRAAEFRRDLLGRADVALYESKSNGRNQVTIE